MAYALQRRERPDAQEPLFSTGRFSRPHLSAEPASVGTRGALMFTSATADYRVCIYEIAGPVVPNWFIVGYPTAMKAAGAVTLFFHPTPMQADIVDGAYPTKTQLWPRLIRYAHRLAAQAAIAGREVISIVPLMTQKSTIDCGILPAHWHQIVSDIVADVAKQEGLIAPPAGAFTSFVVASFSAGIRYSDVFRRTAAGLSRHLTHIVDLDAQLSSEYRVLAETLTGYSDVMVLRYDQREGTAEPFTYFAGTRIFHVPRQRWAFHPPPPQQANPGVHGLMTPCLWRHALSVMKVG